MQEAKYDELAAHLGRYCFQTKPTVAKQSNTVTKTSGKNEQGEEKSKAKQDIDEKSSAQEEPSIEETAKRRRRRTLQDNATLTSPVRL